MKDKELYSNCCNAFMSSYFEDVSICPECKEHCGMEEKCPSCDGLGYTLSIHPHTGDNITCADCGGLGSIEYKNLPTNKRVRG